MKFSQWMGTIIDHAGGRCELAPFGFKRKRAAIAISFMLSVATLPCAAAWGQDGWKKIENEYFSFSLPSSFRKTEAHGIDSFVEEYATERIKLGFDYGIYSNNFFGWPENTKFEYLRVDGEDARI